MLCHSCRCRVEPTPPNSAWKILNVVFWVASMTLAVLFSLAMGLNLLLAPAAIFVGMSIGTAARRMTSWTCPRCHEELIEPEPQTEIVVPPTDFARTHAL
jgi:hypothetical protein